jgi:hypothetical protein
MVFAAGTRDAVRRFTSSRSEHGMQRDELKIGVANARVASEIYAEAYIT